MLETLLKPAPVQDKPMPFSAHLSELRRRFVLCVCILGFGVLVAFNFTEPILNWLARPVGRLVFLSPLEAFHARLEIAFLAALTLTLPLLLHQAWLFVAPALSAGWQRLLRTLFPLSYLLFLAGGALNLFLVLPATVKFLMTFKTKSVEPMMTLGAYLGFAVKLTFAFGAVSQMPLILYGLNRAGVLEKKTLAAYRKPAYLLCFITGALLSPDVFAQLCIAIPSIVLFEITLLTMRAGNPAELAV